MGNYTINISQPAPGSPQLSYSDANYVIDQTFNPGILTITPAPLTITASNQSEIYGTDTPNAGPNAALDTRRTFTVSSGQLFNGDSVASVTLFTNATLSSSSHYNAGTWTHHPQRRNLLARIEQQLRHHLCQRPHRLYRRPAAARHDRAIRHEQAL